MKPALGALLLLLAGASPPEARDDTLKQIRGTFAKWGITFETGGEAALGRGKGPLPSEFQVGGKIGSNDEAELNTAFAFGGPSTHLKIGGKVKVTGDSTSWDGKVSIKVGEAEFEGEFASGKQLKIGAELQQGMTLIGCQIGSDDEGPVSFGLTALGMKLKIDPRKYVERMREVGPQIFHKLDLSGKFTMLMSGVDVGGVLIHFSPENLAQALTDSNPPAASVDIERGRVRMLGGPDSRPLQTVSLSRLLSTGSATLGDLTRVTGYALEGVRDIHLLGIIEPGRPKIAMDCLTVALRAIWKEGTFPYVSLDPDPGDFSGPQKVRVGGLPETLRNSEFVEILLEADYAMKRIDLGEDDPGVPGFERYYDLIARGTPVHTGMNRSWLAPRQPQAAEIRSGTDGNRTALTFVSGVRILTERERSTMEGLVGTGESDPVAQAAADNFTRFYSSIAVRREIFHKLSAIFDLALLSAILRSKQVTHARLDQAASRAVAAVTLKAHYSGIGPRPVAGTMMALYGGAVTELEFLGGEFATGGTLKEEGGTLEVVRPADPSVSGAEARQVAVSMMVQEGLAAFLMGRYEAAQELLSFAISLKPDLVAARGYRALTRMMLDDQPGCREDLEASIPRVRELQALRGFLRLKMGDREGALRDAGEAFRAFPHEACVVEWAALTCLLARDWEAAEKHVKHLWALAPHSPEAYNLKSLLSMLRGLAPERAAARTRALLQLPVRLADSMSSGMSCIQNLDYEAGIRELRRCFKLAERPEWRDLARAGFVPERCRMALSLALAGRGKMIAKQESGQAEALRKESEEIGKELARLHPDWPIAALLAGIKEPKEAVELFNRVLKSGVGGDPLLEDFAAISGTSRALALVGFALWFKIQDKDSREAKSIIDALIPLLGAGPEADLFKALREAGDDPNPQRSLSVLRRAHRNLPDRPAADAITYWCVGFFYQTLVMVEQQRGDGKNSIEAGLKYLRLTEASQPSLECLNQTLTLRLAMLALMAGDYGKRFQADERVRKLRRDVSNGRIELESMRRTLAEVRGEVVAQARTEGTPFTAAFAHFFMASPERRLRDEADAYLKGVSDASERDRLRAALDAWDREIEHRRTDRAARQKSNEESLGMLVEGARTQMEFLTVGRFFEMTQAALVKVEDQAPDESRDIQSALGALSKKYAPLKARLFEFSGSDQK